MKFGPLGFLSKSKLSPLHCYSFSSVAAPPSVVLVLVGVRHQPTLEWKHKFDSCHQHALSYSLTMKPFNDPGTVWTPVMENTFSSPFLSQESCGGTRLCDVVLVSPQPSGNEGQTGNIHKERERLRLVLKQMGRIKCPSEVCSPSFFCVPFSFPFSHSLLVLLSNLLHFHLSDFHNTFSSLIICQFQFWSPFSSGSPFCFCLLLPLIPFSYMPCSWHVAQNHINTLLPITHTRVQKAERGGERAAKNRLYALTCPHIEKWAVSSCFLCLFNSSHQILTNSRNSVPLNLHFVPLIQFRA